MELDGIRYSVADGVARIALARPEASNSFDLATASSLATAVAEAGRDETVRSVLITGDGARFCAGGDLPWAMSTQDPSAALLELADVLDGAFQAISALPKPVVAAVQGAAAGAGLALVLAADVVVAASGTKFLSAYGAVGLVPDCGLSWQLPRAIGQQRALELVLTNRALSAEEALAWGLVNRVVDADQLEASGLDLAAKAAGSSAFAAAQTKRLVRQAYDVTRAEAGADEARSISAAIATPEAQDLIAAFFKR